MPLVALSWFVLFIAVAAGTQERRFELGLLALRGARLPNRWWLAAGEAILPILAGSVAGYLVGHFVVRTGHAAAARPGRRRAARYRLQPLDC